jgi:ribose transport system substrate-binding protein
MAATEDVLQGYPDLDAIFGINDDSALGALAAVEAAGKQDRILIVGYDAVPEARQAILKGTALKADVVQHPEKIGRQTIDTVAKHLKGEQVEPWIPVEVGIVDKASLEAEAAERKG